MNSLARAWMCVAMIGVATAAFAQHPDHTAVVAAVKADLVARGVDLLSPNDTKPCNVFAITKRVAWQLRGEGIGYVKKGGNNCEGFSTDALMYRDGTVIDTLVGSGETNGPTWNVVGTRPLSDWAAPVDPGDTPGPPPPPPTPPGPSVDLGPLLTRLDLLEQAAQNAAFAIAELRNEVGAVETRQNAVDARIQLLETRPTVTGCHASAFGVALHCELTR